MEEFTKRDRKVLRFSDDEKALFKQFLKQCGHQINTLQDICMILNTAKNLASNKDRPKVLAEFHLDFLEDFKSQNQYSLFEVKKKNGGVRTIAKPNVLLGYFQSLSKLVFDTIYKSPKAAHGFIYDKGIITNASEHVGKLHVYNLDISSFFESIDSQKIETGIRNLPFVKKHKMQNLTLLIPYLTFQGVLPTGASTSPVLSNICFYRLDKLFESYFSLNNITYTRYADDITLSTNDNYSILEQGITFLKYNLKLSGFEVNLEKERIQTYKGYRGKKHFINRQVVTGLVVNEKLNLNRNYIKQVRAILHNWEAHGINYVITKWIWNNKRSKNGKLEEFPANMYKNGKMMTNSFISEIRGRINYIGQVRGKTDLMYKKFDEKFKKLILISFAEISKISARNKVRRLQLLQERELDPNILTSKKINEYKRLIDLNERNKTFLFFDVETNGLPLDYNGDASDLDNWPRIVQLAYILTNRKGEILASKNFIIKPIGFNIPKDSTDIHGITTEFAMQHGRDISSVLQIFKDDLLKAGTLVAHNYNFDSKVVISEFIRSGIDLDFPVFNSICTMLKSVDFCKIPSEHYFGQYKWPKLSELYMKLFESEFEGAHDAMVDIQATVECFWELVDLKVITIKV